MSSSSKFTLLTSHSAQETTDLGVAIGKTVSPATLIGLVGSLGAGKTNLTQGIGQGIGTPPNNVVSPTFTICVPHYGRLKMLHLDAYRIKDGTEVDELGLDEELEEGTVVIVEWADRIESYLPEMDLVITIESISEDQRQLQLDGRTDIGAALVRSLGLP